MPWLNQYVDAELISLRNKENRQGSRNSSEDSEKELLSFEITEYQVTIAYYLYFSGQCAQDCSRKIAYKEK